MLEVPAVVREGLDHRLETVDVGLEPLDLTVDLDVLGHELAQPVEPVGVAEAVVPPIDALEVLLVDGRHVANLAGACTIAAS
jgi:hypothetical protein